VTKCDRGRGSKLVQNSMTYFMDGPKGYNPEHVENYSMQEKGYLWDAQSSQMSMSNIPTKALC